MPSPGGDRRFIGRTHQLDRLHRGLAQTVEGRGAIVVISGESGVGKSRLVDEFVDQARRHGAEVLMGGCAAFGENGPSYRAVLEALRPVWGRVGAAEPSSTGASLTNPSSLEAGADQLPPGPNPLFELALQVLRRLAEEAPVVLVIEDVHWSDRSTGDLLAFLTANLHRDRVMVIVTYRSEAPGRRHSLLPLLMELQRGRRAEFLDVRPFTRQEMVAQLHGILGRRPEDDLLDLTWIRSDGNALFAEEVVAAIAEGVGVALAPTPRHLLLSRVDLLPEPSRRLLRLVAAAREGVSFPVLAEVFEQSEGDLLAAVREAVDHRLLEITTDGQTYKFRHSLRQEVLYDDLLPGERQLFHAAYGRALNQPGTRPDSAAAAKLAYHWDAAGDAERALVAALDAAALAAGIYGFAEAQMLYERAIGLWDQVANASEVVGLNRFDLFERAAEVAHRAGDHGRASALMAAALAGSETEAGEATAAGRGAHGGNPDGRLGAPVTGEAGTDNSAGAPISRGAAIGRARWQRRLGRYLWAAGDSRDALRAYQEAVRCLPAGEASVERARVAGSFARALMLSGRYQMSCQQAEAALQVARGVGARLEEMQILTTLGFDLVFLGDSSSGLSALERAQVIAEERGDPDDIGRAYLHRAELLCAPLNLLEEAVEVAQRGVTRVGLLGLERTYGAGLQAIGVKSLFRLGRWSEADDLVRQALAAKPTGTAAIELSLARADLFVGRGHFDAAEGDLMAAATLAGGALGARYEASLLLRQAGLDVWLGRAAKAREAVTRGIVASVNGSVDVWLLAPLIWHGLRAEAELAEAARARRDDVALAIATALAGGLWAQAQSLAAESGTVPPVHRRAIDAYLCLSQGEAARAAGRPEPQLWAEAGRRWRHLRQPYPSAYADWRHAEALLAQRSRSSRAAELLKAAHQVALRLGAVPLRGQVEGLAHRARLVLDAPTAEPQRQAAERVVAQNAAKERYGLSRRELEVWLRLPEGLTNKQIGQLLFISGKTVSVHVTNILRKLGLRTRVQAITMAHQLGLVDVDVDAEVEVGVEAPAE